MREDIERKRGYISMRKSIKTMVGIRVAFAFAAVLVYSLVVTFNVFLIKDAANSSSDASTMLDTIEKAETAHYKWSSSLSSALYAGIDFEGRILRLVYWESGFMLIWIRMMRLFLRREIRLSLCIKSCMSRPVMC